MSVILREGTDSQNLMRTGM